ncbi:MAG: Fe-S protein assembly co-chaperone HscB [Alphaproteobacteria bacterium]
MSDIIHCWSCQSETDAKAFFCKQCHIIQPPLQQNPFDILGIMEDFDIDEKLVEKQYFEQQKQLHPDRFATKTSKEKMYALAQATALNDAYSILKKPIDRADYLCVTFGGTSYKDDANNRNVLPEILMESMMQREALSQANDEASLQKMFKDNKAKQQQLCENISQDYKAKDTQNMQNHILSLQYTNRFTQEIQAKIAKLKGNSTTSVPMASPL